MIDKMNSNDEIQTSAKVKGDLFVLLCLFNLLSISINIYDLDSFCPEDRMWFCKFLLLKICVNVKEK